MGFYIDKEASEEGKMRVHHCIPRHCIPPQLTVVRGGEVHVDVVLSEEREQPLEGRPVHLVRHTQVTMGSRAQPRDVVHSIDCIRGI